MKKRKPSEAWEEKREEILEQKKEACLKYRRKRPEVQSRQRKRRLRPGRTSTAKH